MTLTWKFEIPPEIVRPRIISIYQPRAFFNFGGRWLRPVLRACCVVSAGYL